MKKLWIVLVVFMFSCSEPQTKFIDCNKQLLIETERADRNAVLIWIAVFCLFSTHAARSIFKREDITEVQ